MASTSKVSELLRDIDQHEYILPEFQRGYVWSQKQVKEYLTSVYRSYPTGSFLIWKTPDNQKTRGDTSRSDNKFYKLILDGQQRLTSLYALFRGVPPPFYEGEKLFFNIYFNLDTEEFVYYMPSKMKDNPEWIQVTEFLMFGDVGKFIAAHAEQPEVMSYYSANLTKLIKLMSIHDYEYHLDEVSQLDINEVVDVFNLVNSSGTRLSKADLALAHICSYWPEARDTFKQAQASFAKANFDFSLDFLTICISAVAVDSVLFERSFYTASKETISEAWSEVEQILQYLINILRNDAYIDSLDNLKTAMVLVPMAYYLHKNGGRFETDHQKRHMIYWMFLALMLGRYSGRTYQTLQSDIVTIRTHNNPDMLIEAIKRLRGGNLEITANDLINEGASSRFYPMAYIVARSQGAIDWFNGLNLFSKNIGKKYQIQAHHIFPQAVLYKYGYNSSDSLDKRTVNDMANLAFITQEANLKISDKNPLQYLQEIKQKYPKALKNQFMPDEDYWDIKRYADFLQKRRELVAAAINKFMNNLLSSDEITNSLSNVDMIAQGENEMVEFKGALRWSPKLSGANPDMEFGTLRTLAGFMNYNGGLLFLGVTDRGEINGIENDFESLGGKKNSDSFENHINNLVKTSLGAGNRKYIHIDFETVSGKTIAVVRVEASKSPVFVKTAGGKQFFVRSGNSTQNLDVEETMEYIKNHWSL
jgi:hypothetical protein